MRNTTALTLVTLSLASPHLALAAPRVYVGDNMNWSDNHAWDFYGPPGYGASVLINPAVPAGTTNTLTLNTDPTLADVTLGSTGPGTMQLALNNYYFNATSITVGSGGVIAGPGYLGIPDSIQVTANGTLVHNSGLLSASNSSLIVELAAGASSNNGTIQATNGGNLTFYCLSNATVDNTNGTIQALAANGTPSAVTLYAAVNGGTLYTDAASSMTLDTTLSNLTATGNFTLYQHVTFSNVTLNGTILHDAQSFAAIVGTLTNNSNWIEDAARIIVTGNQTLTGTGSVTFSHNSSLGADINQTASLTIGSQQTLQGAGTLGTNANLTLINNGSILANTANQSFTINSPLTNNALLSAAANASISITAPLTLSANATVNADGNISLTSTLTGPLHKTGNATLALSQNYTTTSPISLTAGTLALNGPTNSAPAITGNGTLALSGALTLTPSTTASTLAGISFANATIPAGNFLDLTNNTLILNPAPSQKSATLSLLQSALTAGTAHNAGLFSSALAPNQILLLLDNAALPTPFTSFANQPVTTNSLILSPALLGDANLDNTIDLNDLNLILNHLGQSTPLWSNGNFDNAPTIDLNDLNFVLNNLGTSTASPLLPATAPTPEPASFAALSLAFLTLRRRK